MNRTLKLRHLYGLVEQAWTQKLMRHSNRGIFSCYTLHRRLGSVYLRKFFLSATAAAALLLTTGTLLLRGLSFELVPQVAFTASKVDSDVDEEDTEKKKRPLTTREKRFLRFASVEFDGHIYMTPRDFIDSVTQENPRHRIHRKALSEKEVKDILKKTPPRRHYNKKQSCNFFRAMDNSGLISFTEYLFLLCVLTKPKSGFRIAFNMFDMDGNQRVDKKEFLVIEALTLMLQRGGKIAKFDEYLEEIWGKSRKQKQDIKESAKKKKAKEISVWDKQSKAVEEMNVQDTTLITHFFGSKGDWVLTYEDFEGFSESLQTEVLEIEFNEFSQGKPTISETDFAKLLLRYTVVHLDDYRAYLNRVTERIPEEKGISFEQFRQFCQFLNNLDDFSIAMKLYTFADLPVSQAEFARAVKVSTGYALEPHVIHTVFQIFDVNNDGHLSYSEFIAVMKDRIHRGFRSHLIRGGDGWLSSWKSCVREEMKNY